MPYVLPTRQALIANARADAAARLALGPLLQRGPLDALARAQAGHAYHLHLQGKWVFKQVMPDTADGENLDRWAGLWGVVRKPAQFAEGSTKFTGADGTDIPPGTLVQRADGAQYGTDAAATIAAGQAIVAITALLGGADGNDDAGQTLDLVNPIAGIDTTTTVQADANGAGLPKGTAAETDAELLVRFQQRVQATPMGGAAGDYVRWSLEVAGVTRAWTVNSYAGAGTVGVTFMVDDHATSPIPDAATVAIVQAYIDPKRPVTAALTVFAPTEVRLAPDILINPDNGTVRAAVVAELEALILREAKPSGTLFLSDVRGAISNAAGEVDHTVVLPTADTVVTVSQILTLGTVRWQSERYLTPTVATGVAKPLTASV